MNQLSSCFSLFLFPRIALTQESWRSLTCILQGETWVAKHIFSAYSAAEQLSFLLDIQPHHHITQDSAPNNWLQLFGLFVPPVVPDPI